MSTRSGRVRQSMIDTSPSRVRKGISPTRSPARSRKSSPPARVSRKSPSRKSPSRKPAPTPSPKYPARKSPSRAVKEKSVEAVEPAVPKSPVKRPAIKTSALVKLEDGSAKYEIYRSTRSKRTEYSVQDYPSRTTTDFNIGEKLNGVNLDTDSSSFGDIYGLRSRRSGDDVLPRRSSKIREIVDNVPDIRRSFTKSLSKSLSKSASKSISKSLDAFSDEENSEEEVPRQKEKSRSMTRKLATPLPSSIDSLTPPGKFEFGGWLGSIVLIILIPVTVLAILMCCTKSCSYKFIFDLSVFKSYTTWFNKQSLLLLLSQYALQAILVLIPVFGKRVEKVDTTGRKYCFSAVFSAFLTTNLVFALNYFKIVNIDTVLSSYLGLASISYLFGVVLSLIVFVRSRWVDNNDLNPYGHTGYTANDYFVGREIYPYIKKLNLKLWIYRISNITALVLTTLILKYAIILPEKDVQDVSVDSLKELISKITFKPTILLITMMQMIYILNFVMKEYQMTSTFYWQSEGLGYLQIVSSALYPFYFTTISKFVLDADLVLTTNQMIAAFAIYILGFLIMVLSNNIKYEFRRNPLQPRLALLDSMPTFLGKKLLVSNLWGVLRHPNYTGDILIHISLALPGILSQQVIAAAPAFITIVVLLHRAWRDHARCKRRYGAAWHRYCKRVPSVIIPKVL